MDGGLAPEAFSDPQRGDDVGARGCPGEQALLACDAVMGKLLVHVTHGPEAPTRAALAFLVARAAIEEGHQVTMFLAGDSVQLLRGAVLDELHGLGTGALREHFDALSASGVPIYASGVSSKARGVTAADISDSVTMAPPTRLVQLAFEADRVLTY